MNALVTNPLVSIVIPVYNRELYIGRNVPASQSMVD